MKKAEHKPDEAPRSPSRLKSVFRLMAKTILPLVVLAAGAAAYAALKATKPEVPVRAAQEKTWPIRAVIATFATYRPDLLLYGETLAGRQVELRALVAGEVISRGKNLREGGEVSAEEVLLQIDPFDFEGALDEAKATLRERKARLKEIEANITLQKSGLERAQEQLDIAKRDLERALALVGKGSVSKQLADERRLTVSQRQQTVEQFVNNISIQEAKASQEKAAIARAEWGIRKAQRDYLDTVLKAPFDAYVNDVSADVGRMVGINDKVAILLDKNWIDVLFTLSDRQYGRIVANEKTVVGRTVKVVWRVGDQPIEYDATIERVGAEISSESGGVNVYARIRDPTKPIAIRAGAFVEVRVPDREYQNVARLPASAVFDGDTVYVIEKGRLVARKVEVVGAAGSDVLVSGELAPGEQVMKTRLSVAGPGIKVRVR